jgi:hypothetical protein
MRVCRIAMWALLVGIVAGTAYAQQGYPYGGQPGGQGQYEHYYDPQPYNDYDRDQAPDVDVGFFYSELSPYGEWVRHPNYGWVWFPRYVHAGWRPYYYGRWVDSDYGWMWVSEEPFGWATYHYGRWAWDPYVGWLWVPGTDWAPAWVAWQHGHGYVGWAPLPPAVGFQMGVGLQLGGFNLSIGIAPRNFAFVEERRFLDPRVGGYVLPAARNVTIIHNTTNVTNYTVVDNRVVNRGVPVENIERATGRKTPVFRVATAPSPGGTRVQRDVVNVYRPPERKLETVRVARRNNAGLPQEAPAPSRSEPQSPVAKPLVVAPGRPGTAPVPIPVAPRLQPATRENTNTERVFQREQKDLQASQDKERKALEQIQRQETAQAQARKADAQELAKRHAAELQAQQEQRQLAAQQLQTRQLIRRQAVPASAVNAPKTSAKPAEAKPKQDKKDDNQKPK